MTAMLPMLNWNAIAQASAVQIVDCLLGGTLIAMLAGAMLGVTRRQHSGTRFAIWFSALMAIAALPLFSAAWASSASVETSRHAAFTLPVTWAGYLFAAWAVMAGLQLVGVARGVWHLIGLRKSCEPVDLSTLDARLQETLGAESSRRVTLCVSDRVQVPTAIGLVKPAVVLPRWILKELSAEELNQILLHELAHLSRWDDWTNLAQKIVKALLFFHPAVWWIEKRVSLEREMACDEAVLAATPSPRAYAECLTHLAERTLIQRSIELAQAVLGRVHQTSQRVAQILDGSRPAGSGRARKSAVALASTMAIVCVVGLSRAPRLVAFGGGVDASHTPTTSSFEITDHSAPLLPVIHASAKIMPHEQRPALKPAKVKMHRSLVLPERAATQAPVSNPAAANLIHLTSFESTTFETTPFGFTETVFIVVQNPSNGVDAPQSRVLQYQIQMWRVVVLHPAADPNSNRTPAKQT